MKAITYPVVTYPEMDKEIVSLLKLRGGSVSLYAAARIEELEAQVERLLERAQWVEAEVWKAAVWEAAIHQRAIISASDGVGPFLSCMFCGTYCKSGETMKEHEADCPIAHPSEAAAALLERLAELETQTADLCAVLQAALPLLKNASGVLTLPGEDMIDVATDLIEEVIAAIQEDLE